MICPGVALFNPQVTVDLQYHTVSSQITSEERYAEAERSSCL